MVFTSSKIQQSNEIIAEELSKARLEKGLKTEKIAKKLNINHSYLEALENGQLEKLPAGLYGKKILKEYALSLGADHKYLEKLWETETKNRDQQQQQNLFSHRAPHVSYFLTIPKIIKSFIFLLILLLCVSYLGFYLKNIISSPKLVIFEPADNLTIQESFITLSGQTEPEANVSINDINILTDPNGYFFKTINLSTGVNTVYVVAKKKYSKESTIIKRILVEESHEE